jgi:hypothetical protein
LPSPEQVETLLKTQEPAAANPEVSSTSFVSGQGTSSGPGLRPSNNADFNISNPSIGITNDGDRERWRYTGESPQPAMDDLSFATNMNMGMGIDDSTFTWEMIGLGLEEPLPPQDTIDELYVISFVRTSQRSRLTPLFRHQIYFDKMHPSLPMIHKYRYLAAMNL